MNNSLVSIIIPTYNRAHLISETLNSVLAQTYENWECIIVDDGSTDNTDVVVNSYLAKDSRFQYHHRPKDRLKGANACRNYGFELSKGEYINWFDSDDLMSIDLLNVKVQMFNNSNLDVNYIMCGFETFGQNKIVKRIYEYGVIEDLLEKFLSDGVVLITQIILFRKSFISGFKFDEQLTRAQDLDFIFRVLESKSTGLNINEILIKVRTHYNSISGEYVKNKKEDIISELKVRRYILEYYSQKKDENFNIAIIHFLIHLRKTQKSKLITYGIKQIFTLNCLPLMIKLKFISLLLICEHTHYGNEMYKRAITKF
jgi:glycosyltransferase involved in cell wall biosynthesis